MRPILAAALLGVAVLTAGTGAARAGEADVMAVTASEAAGFWSFRVTVRHADEGWEHYADRWEVVASDGTVLGTRTLFHPHVREQPFTRDLASLTIPEGVTRVRVRAHDNRHGFGGQEMIVDLATGETEALAGGEG